MKIQIYEPAVLIVGTRGRSLSGMQGLLPGSVSKYCLQHSPIPVIVVRPTQKREKKKKKRLADPTRRSYNNILQLSEKRGSGLFDTNINTDSNIDKQPEEEAAAVAEAVGLPRSFRHSNSDTKLYALAKEAKQQSKGEHEHKNESDVPSTEPIKSPASTVDDENAVVLKSPTLGGLDSAPVSESEDDAATTVQDTSSTTAAAAPESAAPEEAESSAQEHSTSVASPEVATPVDASVETEDAAKSGPEEKGITLSLRNDG